MYPGFFKGRFNTWGFIPVKTWLEVACCALNNSSKNQGMARPKDQKRRREELVAAAARAVLRRGPAAVRLRDVAEEAGVTPAAVLYYYTPTAALPLPTHQPPPNPTSPLRH